MLGINRGTITHTILVSANILALETKMMVDKLLGIARAAGVHAHVSRTPIRDANHNTRVNIKSSSVHTSSTQAGDLDSRRANKGLPSVSMFLSQPVHRILTPYGKLTKISPLSPVWREIIFGILLLF